MREINSISEYVKALQKKEFSAEEGIRYFLSKCENENDKLHAFLSLEKETAIEEAQIIDAKINAEEFLQPLAGVPIAFKDNIVIEGKKTTAGSKILENYKGSYTATVVNQIKNAGGICIGKTNLDEFAMGASTENSAYGPTKNPHDFSCVPGGSSGGSAVAVAAGLALGALGSDTGGSIRQPAAFCGVCGFKPSYGAVSRFGLIAMASSLDQIGPMAKNVEDISLIFDAIEGSDPYDATSVGVPPFIPEIERVKKIKIGIPKEYFGEGVSSEIKKAIEKTINKFEKAGFENKEVSLPHTHYAISTYYIIVPAEVSANLARFESIRYPKHFSQINEKVGEIDLFEKYARARGYGLGDEVKRRVILGTFVLSAGYHDAYFKKAEKVREIITRDFESVFSDVDMLIAPTTPTVAFKLGEKIDDPLAMYTSDALTIPANLAGLPALSIPIKKYNIGEKELPIGFQIIGKQFADREVLALGDFYEKFIC